LNDFKPFPPASGTAAQGHIKSKTKKTKKFQKKETKVRKINVLKEGSNTSTSTTLVGEQDLYIQIWDYEWSKASVS